MAAKVAWKIKLEEFYAKKCGLNDVIQVFQETKSVDFVKHVFEYFHESVKPQKTNQSETRQHRETPKIMITPTKTKQSMVISRPRKRPPPETKCNIELADLISYFLRFHLVPNFLHELEHILQLIQHYESLHLVELASRILDQILDVLSGLGKSCLVLILTLTTETQQQVPTIASLDHFVEQLQALIDEYPLEDEQESELGQSQPVRHGVGMKLMVPFREETDSRNHFRTPKLVEVYTNRERTRDGFLEILRKFYTHGQHHFKAAEAPDDRKTMQTRLVSQLLESNYEWFAHFFVVELLQIGLFPIGERDPEVLVLETNQHDQERLQKLHRRFSSQKSVKKVQSKTVWNCFAGTTQEFFHQFLRDWDSYRFNVHLQSVLIHKLHEILQTSQQKSTEKVLQLKVLARFIAYLTFSPNTSIERPTTKALELSFQEAIARANAATPALDVLTLIKDAEEHNQLILSVPWVCEYMSLSVSDPIAQETDYFIKMWTHLAQMYRREAVKPSHALVRMCILTQLDTLFVSVNRFDHVLAENTTFPTEQRQGLWIIDSVYVETCCPGMEELRRYLSSVSSKKTRQHTRKMQPDSVEQPPQVVVGAAAPVELQILEHSFFRQHADLQRIATLVIDQIVENATVDTIECIVPSYVDPLLSRLERLLKRNGGFQVETIQAEFKPYAREDQERLKKHAVQHMEVYSRNTMDSILAKMFPPTTAPKVASVAQELAIRHAISLLPTRCIPKVIDVWRQLVKDGVSRLRKAYYTKGSTVINDDAFTQAPEETLIRKLSRLFEETTEEPAMEDEPPVDPEESIQHTIRAFYALNARLMKTKDLAVLDQMVVLLNTLSTEPDDAIMPICCQMPTIYSLLLETARDMAIVTNFVTHSYAFMTMKLNPREILVDKPRTKVYAQLIALYAGHGVVSIPALERSLISECRDDPEFILALVQSYHAETTRPAYDPIQFATILGHLSMNNVISLQDLNLARGMTKSSIFFGSKYMEDLVFPPN